MSTMSSIEIAFALLVAYQLKHFLADYLLQGKYMLGKFKPGWAFLGPLCAHVGVHALMTSVITVVALLSLDQLLPADLVFLYAIELGLFDAGVHFIMDRVKASPRLMGRWKPVTASEYMEAKDVIDHRDSWYVGLPSHVAHARRKLRGNVLFWWALGFDQMVHHLTHYVCIYWILKLAGIVP